MRDWAFSGWVEAGHTGLQGPAYFFLLLFLVKCLFFSFLVLPGKNERECEKKVIRVTSSEKMKEAPAITIRTPAMTIRALAMFYLMFTFYLLCDWHPLIWCLVLFNFWIH